MARLKQRDTYFDNVKGFLILLVVIGHFADDITSKSSIAKTIFIWAYTFHMPLFLFVSGYFSGGIVKSGTRVKRRVFELLSLYLFYKIALYIVDYCINGKGTFSLLAASAIPWYLAVLAVHYVLLYFVKDVKPEGTEGIKELIRNPVLVTSVILALMVGYDSEIRDFLVLSRIIVFFPFFYLGYLLRNINVKEKVKKICPTKVGLILLAASFVVYYVLRGYAAKMIYLFSGRNPYSVLQHLADYGIFFRLLAYVITCGMCCVCLAAIPERKIIGLSAAGESTMQIYLYHQIVRNILRDCGVLSLLAQYGNAGEIVVLLIPVLLTIVLAIPVLGWPVRTWHKAIDKYVN